MRFFLRRYVVIAVLLKSCARPLWERATWSRLVHWLQPLVDRAGKPPSVGVNQLEPGEEPGRARYVRFGRLSWRDESFRKWTHDAARKESGSWTFESAQSWWPSRRRCAKRDLAPDLYLHIKNCARPKGGARAFSQMMILGMAADLYEDVDAGALVKDMPFAHEIRLAAAQERPWGRASGSGFTDALNDLVGVRHLLETESPHEEPVAMPSEWMTLVADEPGAS